MGYKRFIQSIAFPRAFLRMDGSGVTTSTATGSGVVNCQYGNPGPWETFVITDVPDAKGGVVIGSAAFPNVFLRMDGSGVSTSYSDNGGGTVNCSYGALQYERFRLVPMRDGSFGIESVQFPGIFVRLNANGTVNAQGGYGLPECFLLIDPDAHPDARPAGLTSQELRMAIKTYGPVIKFHPNEKYHMCSVEWYLARAKLRDSVTNTDINHPTVNQLPRGPATNPPRYSLIVEDSAKPGDLNTAKAYVHAYWRDGLSYTDLQFWLFYAYNGPGTAYIKRLSFDTTQETRDIDLSPLGEHWGDWECCTIRIDNGSKQMIGVTLSQHSGDQSFSQAQLGAFQRKDQQIVVYSSRNGHALYSSADTNYSEHVKKPDGTASIFSPEGVEFFLRNDTADGGLMLNCGDLSSYEIILADWLPNEFPEKPWVDYRYRWGPEGTSTSIRSDTAVQILKAALGPWEGIMAVLSGDGSAFLEAFTALALPSFVKDDLNGPGAPKTKANWAT